MFSGPITRSILSLNSLMIGSVRTFGFSFSSIGVAETGDRLCLCVTCVLIKMGSCLLQRSVASEIFHPFLRCPCTDCVYVSQA